MGNGSDPYISITWYLHCSDVMMSAMAFQFTVISSVYSNACPGANQRKRQSYASLACVRGIHRGPVNTANKGLVAIWWSHYVSSIIGILRRLYRNQEHIGLADMNIQISILSDYTQFKSHCNKTKSMPKCNIYKLTNLHHLQLEISW